MAFRIVSLGFTKYRCVSVVFVNTIHYAVFNFFKEGNSSNVKGVGIDLAKWSPGLLDCQICFFAAKIALSDHTFWID